MAVLPVQNPQAVTVRRESSNWTMVGKWTSLANSFLYCEDFFSNDTKWRRLLKSALAL